MATITNATPAIASTTNAGPYTTASFTPVANDLLVALVHVTGSATAPSMSDTQSLGWTQVGSALARSSGDNLFIYVTNALAAASAMTVSFNATSPTGATLEVFRVSGMTLVGAAAVRQVATQNNAASGTPNELFGVVCRTVNPVLAMIGNATNPGGLTAPTGWSAGNNIGFLTPTTGTTSAFINSGFTSAIVTWGSASASAFGAIAVEFDTSVKTQQTITGLSRISLVTPKTQLGKANILNTTPQTQLGVSRIQVTTAQTILGKANIATPTPRTQTGISRITAVTAQLQLGLARITAKTLQTQQGRSRITRQTSQTQLGKARITIVTTQVQLGKARITIKTAQIQLGEARITVVTGKTMPGKANIARAATLQTIMGRGRVAVVSLQTMLGKASIITPQQTDNQDFTFPRPTAFIISPPIVSDVVGVRPR